MPAGARLERALLNHPETEIPHRLAGNFFHLWLAHQAHARLPGEGSDPTPLSRAAFLAGSVAPDIGFFPRGPRLFSERVHRERSGAFLRALVGEARDPVERAFAQGWALHVYTDIFFHPLINAQVASFLQRSRPGADPDLWHLRLEWGLDCLLLEAEEKRFLWEAPLCVPLRSADASLLGLVGRRFYGEDAGEILLRRGIDSLYRWIRRLPRIFLWTGSTCPPRCRGTAGRAGRWAGGLLRALAGNRLDGSARWQEVAAAIRPWRPKPAVVTEAHRRGERALGAFAVGLAAQFAALPDLDLQLGSETV